MVVLETAVRNGKGKKRECLHCNRRFATEGGERGEGRRTTVAEGGKAKPGIDFLTRFFGNSANNARLDRGLFALEIGSTFLF